MLAIVYFVQIIDYRSRSTLTGNEYAAETDWSKEQDKGKVSKGRNTKRQNRSIQISSLFNTIKFILLLYIKLIEAGDDFIGDRPHVFQIQ